MHRVYKIPSANYVPLEAYPVTWSQSEYGVASFGGYESMIYKLAEAIIR
jgi:hypothetical protein